MNAPSFKPRPAIEHMRRWPRIIMPTFELHAILRGRQMAPASVPNSPHICDFHDGLRLIVCVNQELPGAKEQLEVCLSAADECHMMGVETGRDYWLRVISERLIDIDPLERPRQVRRHYSTKQGILIALFEWDRHAEEQTAIRELQFRRMDPFPLGRYLEMFTIYANTREYPNLGHIVRRLAIIDGATYPAGAWSAPTLEEARDFIPAGRMNVGRSPQDNRAIVESWL